MGEIRATFAASARGIWPGKNVVEPSAELSRTAS
jgi:hypothetical protein